MSLGANVKDERSHTSTPPVCLCGVDRGKLNFILIYSDSDRREMKYGEKGPLHYCCVWQKSHVDLLGLNPGIWQDRPATNHLNQISALLPIVGRNTD
jgi:hypothetical protein